WNATNGTKCNKARHAACFFCGTTLALSASCASSIPFLRLNNCQRSDTYGSNAEPHRTDLRSGGNHHVQSKTILVGDTSGGTYHICCRYQHLSAPAPVSQQRTRRSRSAAAAHRDAFRAVSSESICRA